jgi:hypothetical protein
MRNDAMGLFWFDEPVIKVLKQPVKKTPPEPVWQRDDYLPGLAQARAATYPLLIMAELATLAHNKTPLYFDIECYSNYFLVAFTEPTCGKYLFFELADNGILESSLLKWVLQNCQLIGFNSNNYDIPMATLATYPQLASPATLKQASDLIIQQNLRPADIYKEFKVKNFPVDSIDIINLLPLEGSLKVYSGRIHAPKLQDLPFQPDKALTPDQQIITRHYCTNDLLDTVLLTQAIAPQLALRCTMGKRYGLDLRSRSDAQIAENVIRMLVEKSKGYRTARPTVNVGKVYRYRVPSFINYQSPMMQAVLSVVKNGEFIVAENGRIGLPQEISSLNIIINQSTYQMGIGGLHSKEKKQCYQATDGMIIVDRDVTSYYPQIILNQKLAPNTLGDDFLNVYRAIVRERIAAKHRGDKVTADCQKIIINSSFGKMGNQYSSLYDPRLVIQITLTGQLALLMLIEALEVAGISVVSGNTDGIVMYTHNSNETKINAIITQWEQKTGFTTEETRYKALYSRDVNNYIALKPDGGVKLKGAYRTGDISKNPVNEICSKALLAYLTEGIPIVHTVTTGIDIRDFLTLRVVRGGAFKDGEYLGKTIRWYKATACPGTIIYARSGNDVPLTEGCRALQELPGVMPEDLDRQWYIENCYAILKDLGVSL